MPSTFDAASVTNTLVSLALETGLFAMVSGHEPESPPPTGLTSAIWINSIGPARRVSGLAATAAQVVYLQRIYNPPTTGNPDAVDPAVSNAAAQMVGVFSSGFTLGGTVFIVDLLGANGVALASKADYINQGGTLFRIADIKIPLIIDGVWGQAP